MRHTAIVLVALLVVAAATSAVMVVSGVWPGLLVTWIAGLHASEAAGDVGVLEGRVTRLDTGLRLVHVGHGAIPLSGRAVAVGPEVDIRISDKIGTLEDLREGVPVKICYEVRERQRWARTIDAPPTPGPCRAVATVTPGRDRLAEELAATRPEAAPPGDPDPPGATATPLAAPGATPPPQAPAVEAGSGSPAPPIEPGRRRRAAVSRNRAAPPPARRLAPPARSRTPHGGASTPLASPAPSRPDASDQGHDYGAVVDWVIRYRP